MRFSAIDNRIVSIKGAEVKKTPTTLSSASKNTEEENINFEDVLENMRILLQYIRKSHKKRMKNKIQKGDILGTALEIAPYLIGFLDPQVSSNPGAVAVKVLQAAGIHMFGKLTSEYKTKIANNELKDKDFVTEKPALIFADFLKIIDEGNVDEERFKAMKSIFYMSAEKKATQEQEELAYRFSKIAKQLSSEEILILVAIFNIVTDNAKPATNGIAWGANKQIEYWASIIAEQIGHNLPDVVLQYEEHLIALRLISAKRYPAVQTTHVVAIEFEPTKYFRMTNLGYKLCEFITKYE